MRLALPAIISNVRLSAANSDSTCFWSMTCIATSPVVICLMASGPRDNSVVLMMAAPPRIDTQDTTCAPKVLFNSDRYAICDCLFGQAVVSLNHA